MDYTVEEDVGEGEAAGPAPVPSRGKPDRGMPAPPPATRTAAAVTAPWIDTFQFRCGEGWAEGRVFVYSCYNWWKYGRGSNGSLP